jgi:hypothetical protein
MSNPIGPQPEKLFPNVSAALADHCGNAVLVNARAYASGEAKKNADMERRQRWSFENLYTRCDGNPCLQPWKSILVGPYEEYVANKSVLTRQFFLASNGDPNFARASIPAAVCQAIAMEMYPDASVTYVKDGKTITETFEAYNTGVGDTDYGIATLRLPSRASQYELARETFVVNTGTQSTLGRVFKATVHRAQKIIGTTAEEVGVAWEASGWMVDRPGLRSELPDVLKAPWPLQTDETEDDLAVVKISKNAGLGIPVCKRADDPEAVAKAIRLAKLLLSNRALVETPLQEYRRLMFTNPGLIAMQAKAKGDAYSIEKIRTDMCRIYGVNAAAPRMLQAGVTSPVGFMKATLTGLRQAMTPLDGPLPWYADDVRSMGDLKSSQGISTTGEGPDLIIASLDAQLRERGCGHITHGDDMFLVAKVRLNERFYLFSFNGDGSNFDLSQTSTVNFPLIEKLAEQMIAIEPCAGHLWKNQMQERLLVLTHGAVVKMKGAITSGMPKVSEVNDLVAQVFCYRYWKAMRVHFTTRDGERYLTVDPSTLESTFKAVGDSMGLSMKFENAKMTPIPSDYNTLSYYLIHKLVCDGRLCFNYLGHKILGADVRTNHPYKPPIRSKEEWEDDDGPVTINMVMRPDGVHYVSRAPIGAIDPTRITGEMQWTDGRWEQDKTRAQVRHARTTVCRMQAVAPWTLNQVVGDTLIRAVEAVLITLRDVPDDFLIDGDDAYNFIEDTAISAAMTARDLKDMAQRTLDEMRDMMETKQISQTSHLNPTRRLKLPIVPRRLAKESMEVADPVGLSWADFEDAMEEQEFTKLVQKYFPGESADVPTSPYYGDHAVTRPVTKKNFGKMPPLTAVRQTIGNVTGGTRFDGQKLSKGARRRRNRATRKARADRTGYEEADDYSEAGSVYSEEY